MVKLLNLEPLTLRISKRWSLSPETRAAQKGTTTGSSVHARGDSSSSLGSRSCNSQPETPSPTESLADKFLKFAPFKPKLSTVEREELPGSLKKELFPSMGSADQDMKMIRTPVIRERSITLESMSLFTPFRDAEDEENCVTNSHECPEESRRVRLVSSQPVVISYSGPCVADEAEVVNTLCK